MVPPTYQQELTPAEALGLLGTVAFGRVVFTARAMPAVSPVRHVVSDGQIVISVGRELVVGSPQPTASASSADTIVAYQADQLDASGCCGWTVVVVGRARLLTDPDEIATYRRLLPEMSVPDQLVGISSDIVRGSRMIGNGQPSPVAR